MSTRILVADDSTTIQKVIRIAFSRYPVEIRAAASLAEARNIVQSETIGLVVMDSCLPGTKGEADLERFAADAQGVPIVFLVGSFEGANLEALISAGNRMILKKPFESREIVDVARKVIGQPFEPAGEMPLPPVPKISSEPKKLAILDLEDEQNVMLPHTPASLPQGLKDQDLREEVRQIVEDYCRIHLESLVKEVITVEIQRLLDQKARL